MPENNGLFEGLDSIVFEQPATIDIADFNKNEPKADDKIVTGVTNDKKDDKSDKTDDKTDGNLINVDDFFNRLKDSTTTTDDKSDDKVEDKTDDHTDDESVKPEDVLKQWSDYFKENTLLADSDLEGFDGSMDTLTEAFKKREYRVGVEMVEDYKSQLPLELKVLADNWEEGVPLNELIDIRSNKIKYSTITDEKLEESLDTQKSVYKDYLKQTTKYSDAKIDKEITRLIDLDELKDEAKDVLKELKKIQVDAEENLKKETKRQRDVRLAENQKTIKEYEKYIKSAKEIVPGLKLDEKEQAKVLNNIINPVGLDPYGNPVSYIANLRNEDPYRFDTAVTYLAEVTKGFTDWSKIVKVGETKAVKGLENILNTAPPKNTKDNIKTEKKQSLMELLEKNKSIFNR